MRCAMRYCALEEAHAQDEGVPDAVDQRLTAIETRLAAMDERPLTFEAAEVARAGARVSIDRDGDLHIERGYVRPEDEPPVAADLESEAVTGNSAGLRTSGANRSAAQPRRVLGAAQADADPSTAEDGAEDQREDAVGSDDPAGAADREPEGDAGTPLPDRLMTELTTHRTLALRQAVGERPDVAFLATLHALCLKLFYPYTQDTCLELDLKQVSFPTQPPGLAESMPAKAIGLRHQAWVEALPRDGGDLWDALEAADDDTRQRLFAHCVSTSVNAVQESWNRRPRALAHAGRLAAAVRLDMAAAGWTPTVDAYLGRVTKARILQAVREARGEAAAERLTPLKKGEMATQAEALLAGSGWLPDPLRTEGQPVSVTAVDHDLTGSDRWATDVATRDAVETETDDERSATPMAPKDAVLSDPGRSDPVSSEANVPADAVGSTEAWSDAAQ